MIYGIEGWMIPVKPKLRTKVVIETKRRLGNGMWIEPEDHCYVIQRELEMYQVMCPTAANEVTWLFPGEYRLHTWVSEEYSDWDRFKRGIPIPEEDDFEEPKKQTRSKSRRGKKAKKNKQKPGPTKGENKPQAP